MGLGRSGRIGVCLAVATEARRFSILPCSLFKEFQNYRPLEGIPFVFGTKHPLMFRCLTFLATLGFVPCVHAFVNGSMGEAVTLKCIPPIVELKVKRGGMTQIVESSIGNFTENELQEYGTFFLFPGDSVLIQSNGIYGTCEGIWIERNDTLLYATPTSIGPFSMTKTYASPGAYRIWDCGDGCYELTFQIAMTDGTPKPLGVDIQAWLKPIDQTSCNMPSALVSSGHIPLTEPYTGLGMRAAGSGGETITNAVLYQSGTYGPIDWVLIELRDALDPSVVVASRAAMLMQYQGYVVNTTDGYSPIRLNAPPGNYFIAVRHRNHLGVMSAETYPFLGPVLPINTASPTFQVYGTDTRTPCGSWIKALTPGAAAALPGPRSIKYTGLGNDRDAVLLKIGGVIPTATVTGYWPQDVNLDGIVKYTGINNDRDVILQAIGGVIPTNTVVEQIPY